jgi:hypothetical protein
VLHVFLPTTVLRGNVDFLGDGASCVDRGRGSYPSRPVISGARRLVSGPARIRPAPVACVEARLAVRLNSGAAGSVEGRRNSLSFPVVTAARATR